MRFVLSITAVLSLLAFYPPVIQALEVSDTSDQYADTLHQLTVRLAPDLKQLPALQQQRLADVKIRLADHPRGLPMALALPGDAPQILISEQFLDGLSHYIEVYLLARERQQPQWIEQYFSQYFWNRHPDSAAAPVKSPWQLFAVGQEEQAQLLAEKQRLFLSVLQDVLLHEMGHHAMDAFYHFRASSIVREEGERKADEWAEHFRAHYLDGENPLGRMLVIAFIFEQDRWAMLSGMVTIRDCWLR